MKTQIDGDCLMITGDDFVNLQESNAKFIQLNSPAELIELFADLTIDGDGMKPEKLIAEIYKISSDYLEKMDSRPLCPDCKEVMVKNHRNDIADMGWRTVWLCGCKTPQDVIEAAEKMV